MGLRDLQKREPVNSENNVPRRRAMLLFLSSITSRATEEPRK